MAKSKEKIMEIVFLLAACVSILAVALICVFLFANGIPAMKKIGFADFLLGTTWKPGNDIYGIFPMILGSIYVTVGAIIIGVPIGLLTAVFLAWYCPEKIYNVVNYEGALALGATHERSVFRAVLPAAKSGIFAGIILGVGRAIGETMAVIMVAGNQARVPKGILKGVRTLTANIVMEMGYAEGLHREALIATGVVLFVFILIINLAFSIIKMRSEKE